MMTRNDAARFLSEGDNYLILTHRRPDGDTLGSAAALCRALRNAGKIAYVLENPEVTPRLAFLLEGLTKETAGEQDTVICVDVASPGMLPKCAEALQERCVLRVDHHGTATSFTSNELVDPKAGACGEIIYDLIVALGLTPDAKTAEALYVATSTDTGCFRFSNTTDHTFRVAAACAEAGADIYGLNQLLFETNTLSKLRMQAWIVENMQLFADGKMAIVAIPRAVEDLLGVTEDDMDNISSFPRTVAGVEMAATLRQTKEGLVKISCRAVPGRDASAVCAAFGGGGHKGAAGASLALPLEEAVKAVKEAMLVF